MRDLSMLGSQGPLVPSPGDIRYDEAMGYPMVQQWRVRSNLYRVKLSTITLSAGEDRAPAARGLGVIQQLDPGDLGVPGPALALGSCCPGAHRASRWASRQTVTSTQQQDSGGTGEGATQKGFLEEGVSEQGVSGRMNGGRG